MKHTESNNKKQRTLGFFKPDLVKRKKVGQAMLLLESKFPILAMKMIHLTPAQAKLFYQEHAERSFFDDLVKNVTSGPLIVFVLEGEEVIKAYRDLLGHTDPKKATPETLRGLFGISIDENSFHGSDSEKSAEREISIFFPSLAIGI